MGMEDEIVEKTSEADIHQSCYQQAYNMFTDSIEGVENTLELMLEIVEKWEDDSDSESIEQEEFEQEATGEH